MTRRIAPSKIFLSLVLLAAVVRLAVLWLNLSSATPLITLPDSTSYVQCAESLARNFSFVGEDGRATWCRPPAYPALLALTFITGIASPDKLTGVLIVQILLSSAVVALTAHLVFLFGGDWRGVLAGALLVFEPSSIAYSNLVLSETLYTFILIAGILACWTWLVRPTWRRLIGFAVLASALPLVRPIALHLPWVLFPVVFWRAPTTKRFKHAVVFLSIALLPSAVWTARNWAHFGSAAFDQTGPLAKALFARQVEIRAGAPDLPFGPEAPWHRQFANGDVLPAPEAMARQEAFFRDTLQAHPSETAKEVLYTGAMLIGVPDSYLHDQVTGHPIPFMEGSVVGRLRWIRSQGSLIPLILLGMALSVGGVVLLPFFAWRATRFTLAPQACAAFIVIMIVYHLVLSSFVRYQGERYRVPILPLLVLTLVLGASGVPRDRSSSR